MLTNTDCTIYNKIIENRLPAWKRTVIEKVHWEEGQKSNIESTGLAEADEAVVFIPFSSAAKYKTPKEYIEEPEGHFTLRGGDIVVKGIVNDEIQALKDLTQKYDFVHEIATVDINDFGSPNMQHFEVGLK